MKLDAACRAGLLVFCATLTVSCDAPSTNPTPVPTPCEYAVSPALLQPCMFATQLTATVTTGATCTWTATASESWMTIASGSSGTGPGTLAVSVANNWAPPRSGAITVAWPGSSAGVQVRVSQAGCSYSVTQESFAFGAAGGSGSFTVMQMADPNTCGGPWQDACVWTVQSDASWIVITTPTTRSGDEAVRFNVPLNTTGATRTGTLTVQDKVVRVTQSAA